MVPYLVDGLPRAQAEAARSMSRIPLVYATVQLRTRSAFANMGTWGGGAVGTGAEWVSAFLDYPISMGGYEYPMDLDGPGLIHMTATPTIGGMSPREGAKLGRSAMLGRPFEDYERSIRTFAARALGDGGLDPADDIQAITINRWAHGYSFEYAMPWDAAFYPDGPLPGEVAAAPFGRITFANTDRSSRAYTDSAIDAAYAAVHEQPG
jgi:spermidine dehydrogenase